ncbi:MAG: ABC transporter ATP-binding protein [Candidatus Riflebacteria bacterium]|nr:ABC transporter ATP-binding protein [Candidatus Riflebacteria bacterium]
MSRAIFVENLKKAYGEKLAVNNISFEVNEGEIFGFLGPNGAGKTTTIRMMIGNLVPNSGNIELLGKSMPGQREEIKEFMGVVPDNQNLYDRLTVRQNLAFFAQLHESPPERIDELIKLLDLEAHKDVQTQNLSRGLRQRTLIARALIHRPKIFFLDEPTSALDPQSALSIRNLISSLKKEGTTVFITTHYMEEADILCDRIAVMHNGKIVATDTPETLKLQHGRRTVKITWQTNESKVNEETELLFSDKDTPTKIAQLMGEKNIMKIHSQEATLEKVFLNLTGDSLKKEDSGIE